ncbi:MAG: hypothetical protein P4K97_00515 [Terracidiphilus sp.]|nr:hypothetical protein [Terracidiphilus sp.]
MASISFPTTTNSVPDRTQVDSTAKTTAVQTEQTTTTTATTAQEDSVKISAAAQAKLLHQQGQSVTVIAAALGTTTKAVDGYLGITLTQALEKTLQATEAATTAKA